MILSTYSKALAMAQRKNVPPAFRSYHYSTRKESSRRIATSLRRVDTKDLEQDSTSTNTTPASLVQKSSPMATLFQDVDEIFDKNPFFSSSKHSLMNHFWKQMDLMDDMRRGRYLSNTYFPTYDIHSDNDKVQVLLDLPGVNMNDIDVNIEHDKFLHVTGTRNMKGEHDSMTEMKFDKRFNFGKDVIDSTKVLANLANGVLMITLPKLPTAKVSPENVKKIEVVNGSEELEC